MKRNFGVKAKLLLSFIVFSVLVIALLWLLEVVFLDEIYRAIKINSVRSTAENMCGMDDAKITQFALDSSSSVGLCISVFDDELNVLAQEHTSGRCVVHNLTPKTISILYRATRNFEDERFESHLTAQEISDILRRTENTLNFFRFPNGFAFSQEKISGDYPTDAYDCVLYSQIFMNDQGEERYALISAVLLPIESTVQTIRFELNLLNAILILVSVLMSVVLSKTISAPIAKLNKASKTLPEGYFDGSDIKGYREVEELAQTLRISAYEIQQVEHLRKELIANVSHDLRTPLTLISAYSEVMRDIPGENTPENLQVVIDESHRLSELVTDLMDLSKLEAGMENLNLEKIEFVSAVRQILTRYEKMTGVKGYTIQFDSNVEQVFVFADSVKLNQVIYNLVNNAINYCGEDKVVLVKLFSQSEKVLLEVIDHGAGIPNEKLPYIWDRYYRVDSNHRSAPVGTGLGLSIVKKILLLHGAEFGVQSSAGEGSIFWFSLGKADR